jgi:hypothetical protein
MSAGDDHLRTLRDLRVSLDQANERCAEWRRLVNEARADAVRENAAQRDEIDRLKGELAMERSAYDATLYKLKGELAEARRLIREACGEVSPEMRVEFNAFLAAPPAEHPYPGHCLECSPMQIPQGMATAPPADQARVASWKVELDEAEQAQGEGALTLEMLDEVLRDHINDEYDRSTELAKRVKALMEMVADQAEALRLHTHLTKDGSATYSPAPPPPEAAGPTCEKLIGSLNAPCTKRRNHGGDCEHDTREAAGPGHRFICSSGFDDNCGPSCVCKECDHRLGDHAVPPIPEGTR